MSDYLTIFLIYAKLSPELVAERMLRKFKPKLLTEPDRTMKNKDLSESEAVILGNFLAKAKFPLPRPAFDGWVENLPHVAFELAILQAGKNGWEIFMTQRAPDDKFWPNEWNLPGTIVRQNERTEKTYKRLLQNEMLSDGDDFGKLQFIGKCELPKGEGRKLCRRGHEIGLLHVVGFAGDKLKGGRFFTVSKLPRNTVPHHHTLVAMVRRFLKA